MGTVVRVKLPPGTDPDSAKRLIESAVKSVTDEPVNVIVSVAKQLRLPQQYGPGEYTTRPKYI
jgi:hypothetical protein